VIAYLAGRLLSLVPVLLGVTILVFGMLHLVPGDPVIAMLGDTGAPPQEVERLRTELGLNDPLYEQYGRFLARAVTGDLGRSIRSNRKVVDEIGSQLPSTVELAVASMLTAIAIGVALGAIAAYRHNTWVDTTTMLLALLGVSMPSFWLGLILLFVFAVWLGWLPVTGQGGLERLILPAATLGFILSAPIARLTRSALLDVLSQDYVRTARAKGLREFTVVVRHALRNALIPVITIVGLQFGALLAGAVIVETVFARQGIGSEVVTAILNRDFPLAQGVVLLMATSFVLMNLLVDLLYGWLDPRVRYR
jgi:ABC-type dipeptide/oligopeptide/nickel transport system permease component